MLKFIISQKPAGAAVLAKPVKLKIVATNASQLSSIAPNLKIVAKPSSEQDGGNKIGVTAAPNLIAGVNRRGILTPFRG